MKALIILLALSLPALARIGETKEQCVKRYGSVKLSFGENLVFRKSGVEISVKFSKDVVCWINFTKKEGSFDEDEIKTLLNANGPGVKWRIENEEKDAHYFDVENKLYAAHKAAESALTIVTIEFIEGRAKENEKAKKEALKGF